MSYAVRDMRHIHCDMRHIHCDMRHIDHNETSAAIWDMAPIHTNPYNVTIQPTQTYDMRHIHIHIHIHLHIR